MSQGHQSSVQAAQGHLDEHGSPGRAACLRASQPVMPVRSRSHVLLCLILGGVTDRLTYQDRRPYAVPISLAELVGPVRGRIELPLRLACSGRRTYDLDDPRNLAVLYERVIVEAANVTDLTSLLSQEILVGVWSELYLPFQVRSHWESRFPSLPRVA